MTEEAHRASGTECRSGRQYGHCGNRTGVVEEKQFAPVPGPERPRPAGRRICHRPPLTLGNGRTYTSERPDSFDEYTSQLPSAESRRPVPCRTVDQGLDFAVGETYRQNVLSCAWCVLPQQDARAVRGRRRGKHRGGTRWIWSPAPCRGRLPEQRRNSGGSQRRPDDALAIAGQTGHMSIVGWNVRRVRARAGGPRSRCRSVDRGCRERRACRQATAERLRARGGAFVSCSTQNG